MFYLMDTAGRITQTEDVQLWGEQFKDMEQRRVGHTILSDGVYISTVFLGVNHGVFNDNPVLFETMIFGGPMDEYQDRYETKEAALIGHEKAVQEAQEYIDKAVIEEQEKALRVARESKAKEYIAGPRRIRVRKIKNNV